MIKVLFNMMQKMFGKSKLHIKRGKTYKKKCVEKQNRNTPVLVSSPIINKDTKLNKESRPP